MTAYVQTGRYASRLVRRMPRDRRPRPWLALACTVAGLGAVAGLWWAVRALGVG